METKHTPGPWEYKPFIDANEHVTGERVYANSKLLLETSDDMHDNFSNQFGLEERIFNAKLIAAAPKLLEACKLAMDSLLSTEKGYKECEEAIKLASGN